jgi:hypothetical protein
MKKFLTNEPDPPLASAMITSASMPSIQMQTALFEHLSPKLRANLPSVDTIRIIQISIGEEIGYDNTILMRASSNGSVLVFTVWLDARITDKCTRIYKTINKQVVLFKLVLRGKPLIVMVNCGALRGSKCFYVEGTYEKGGSGFKFGLQAHQRWEVPGWNPLCPDFSPPSFRGADSWEELLSIDLIARHVHHYAYPPRPLYLLSLLCCCCLCPQIALAGYGNFYKIEDRDLFVAPSVDLDIKITEISNADGNDPELRMPGLFAPLLPEGPQGANLPLPRPAVRAIQQPASNPIHMDPNEPYL